MTSPWGLGSPKQKNKQTAGSMASDNTGSPEKAIALKKQAPKPQMELQKMSAHNEKDNSQLNSQEHLS